MSPNLHPSRPGKNTLPEVIAPGAKYDIHGTAVAFSQNQSARDRLLSSQNSNSPPSFASDAGSIKSLKEMV